MSLEERAEGRVFWTAEARTGRRALLVEKSNGQGSLRLTLVKPLPAKPESLYESAVYLRVKRRQYGTAVQIHNRDLGAEGKALGEFHDSAILRQPNFSRGQEWQRHWTRWITDKGTAAIQVAFRIEGNPMTLAPDDFEVIASPPPLEHKAVTDSTEPL